MIILVRPPACQQRSIWHIPYQYKLLIKIRLNQFGGYQSAIGKQNSIMFVTIDYLYISRTDNEVVHFVR